MTSASPLNARAHRLVHNVAVAASTGNCGREARPKRVSRTAALTRPLIPLFPKSRAVARATTFVTLLIVPVLGFPTPALGARRYATGHYSGTLLKKIGQIEFTVSRGSVSRVRTTPISLACPGRPAWVTALTERVRTVALRRNTFDDRGVTSDKTFALAVGGTIVGNRASGTLELGARVGDAGYDPNGIQGDSGPLRWAAKLSAQGAAGTAATYRTGRYRGSLFLVRRIDFLVTRGKVSKIRTTVLPSPCSNGRVGSSLENGTGAAVTIRHGRFHYRLVNVSQDFTISGSFLGNQAVGTARLTFAIIPPGSTNPSATCDSGTFEWIARRD